MILSDDNYHQYKAKYNIPENFHLFREHYPFGYAPSFRGPDTPKDDYMYVFTTTNGEKAETRVYTWESLKALLRDTWRPKSQDDCNWFMSYVAG